LLIFAVPTQKLHGPRSGAAVVVGERQCAFAHRRAFAVIG
jgi:hypothetical protein